MKEYTEYNHKEIETIANKFGNEFVTKEELNKWYEYKQAVKNDIHNIKQYLKIVYETHSEDDDWNPSQITVEAKSNLKKAQKELQWIRSIVTFPLQEFCDYYYKDVHRDEERITMVMAKRVIDGVTPAEEQIIREFFEESELLQSINNFRNLTTPVTLRKWTYMNRNPTEYCHIVSSCDATQLYDEQEHYVYIAEECTNHRWGDSYWISVDCDNTLYSLPVIKDFKKYDFQIGKFYKIQCTDIIHFGRNKKKYIMDIQESSEEEFLTKGLHQYATRW